MIDWNRFAARVPAGTIVKHERTEGNPHYWAGIILENKPFVEDRVNRDIGPDHLRRDYEYWDCNPSLRLQDFEAHQIEVMSPILEEVYYLINDEWLSFNEVMALPAGR